eukprot:SAG11_NODE_3199_length_2615_cov_1484.661765_2_plen_105_part_00
MSASDLTVVTFIFDCYCGFSFIQCYYECIYYRGETLGTKFAVCPVAFTGKHYGGNTPSCRKSLLMGLVKFPEFLRLGSGESFEIGICDGKFWSWKLDSSRLCGW